MCPSAFALSNCCLPGPTIRLPAKKVLTSGKAFSSQIDFQRVVGNNNGKRSQRISSRPILNVTVLFEFTSVSRTLQPVSESVEFRTLMSTLHPKRGVRFRRDPVNTYRELKSIILHHYIPTVLCFVIFYDLKRRERHHHVASLYRSCDVFCSGTSVQQQRT